MNLNDLFTEEKVRLDPKCWTGKKIGNPKTKMKGGTRVNNCVPAESVNEMDKSQTPPGRDGSTDSDAGKKEYTAKATTPKKVAKDAEKILNKELNKKQGVAEATGDEKFDTMMGQIQREPKYPDSQMPPTDVKDLYQWAVKNNKPYHKIFAEWANREGYKSVALALQRAGDLDTEALDYWTPRVWEIYWGEVRGIDSEMPPEWAKKRIPDELRDYLDTVFDAYDRIVFDWPTEYRQIGQQGVAEEYELAGVGVAYELGRRAYKQGMTIRDNPYSATKEARKNDEWAKGLERGKHDANDARHFRSSVREQAVAEGLAQDEAEEYGGWRAEFVNEINYNTFEVKLTNTRSKESANFIVRPVDMVSNGPTLSIETMDVHDLQTGQTESWTNDDPAPDGPIAYAISGLFYDDKQLQKKLQNIIDTHDTKGQDMMPGLEKRRSIGQEVDADAYIDSQEKTQAAMAKMKKGVAEKLGDNRPKLGSKRDAGKSIRKWRKTRGLDETGEQQKGADYRDPKEVDYDDDYDAMVSRVKKLAGVGPMKTVYDPEKRVYRNVPTAVQPKR